MIIPFLLVSFWSDMRINTIRLMPPTCDSRKGFTFLSQLKFFWELLTGWAVQKWYASIQSIPTDIHTHIQTGRHKCIQTYTHTDWEGIQSYYQLTFITPSFCRSSVFIYARPRFIGCSWISIGDASVRPKEMRVLMVCALNKTPWFKGNKNCAISAEMSMQTLDICFTSTHFTCMSSPIPDQWFLTEPGSHRDAYKSGIRFRSGRCIGLKCPAKWRGRRHDVINGSFHMKWWNTTAMTGNFKISKAEYERTLSIWGT